MELKKKNDNLIGKSVITKEGANLTVKDVFVFKGKRKYILECSVCSEDKELWPHGSISCVKSSLLKGNTPCGCSKRPLWTELQNRVRVERECELRGYIFHGWEGVYTNSSTLLDLSSKNSGLRWNTTSLSNFLSGSGNIKEGWGKTGKSLSKSDSYFTDSFISTGAFLEGTRFWRSGKLNHKGRKTYWYYSCPECSNDEYVQSGNCSGVFEGEASHLKQGKISCRCYRGFRWNRKQRDYQIRKLCDEEELSFLGWESGEGYVNTMSRIRWQCKVHHKNSTSVGNFLKGRRCKSCSSAFSNRNGYYLDRKEEEDTLYILNFDNKYIKVGRSFNVDNRIKQLSTTSGIQFSDITKIGVVVGTHQEIYELEQGIHRQLRRLSLEYVEVDGLWSKELFRLTCRDILFRLLKESPLYLEEFTG
ncbi:endonuclease [Vibrio phage 5P1c]